jgi:hypothetical protein
VQPAFFGSVRFCARYSVRVKDSLLMMSGMSGYTYEMVWGPKSPIILSYQVFGTANHYSSRPEPKLGQATVSIVCAQRLIAWPNCLGNIRRSSRLLLVCSRHSSGRSTTPGYATIVVRDAQMFTSNPSCELQVRPYVAIPFYYHMASLYKLPPKVRSTGARNHLILVVL